MSIIENIDEIERAFIAGDISKLKESRCPYCGSHLSFSIYKGEYFPENVPGRRYRCGISIGCLGENGRMISHCDGFCPAWAEDISDWVSFSQAIYS